MTDGQEGKITDGPRYIVVEGPIGVGKTSLAKRLAESFDSELVLERADENPFLERFYRSRRHTALPAQLHFLLQRAQQVEEMRQDDLFAPVRIADFLIEKDRLFAELNLDAVELELYNAVASRLQLDAPQPDLVIYLQASSSVLLQRIARRGIDYEEHIDREYLEKLGVAYAEFFHRFDAAPLLIVNAETIDPIHREADYRELLRTIMRVKRGRHFFNPAIESIN